MRRSGAISRRIVGDNVWRFCRPMSGGFTELGIVPKTTVSPRFGDLDGKLAQDRFEMGGFVMQQTEGPIRVRRFVASRNWVVAAGSRHAKPLPQGSPEGM